MNTYTLSLSTNKKVIGILKSEVGSGKLIEEAEAIQFHR